MSTPPPTPSQTCAAEVARRMARVVTASWRALARAVFVRAGAADEMGCEAGAAGSMKLAPGSSIRSPANDSAGDERGYHQAGTGNCGEVGREEAGVHDDQDNAADYEKCADDADGEIERAGRLAGYRGSSRDAHAGNSCGCHRQREAVADHSHATASQMLRGPLNRPDGAALESALPSDLSLGGC